FTIKMNCGIGRDEDAGVYVSHCPTLEIYSQGETEEEALAAIKSAITMHLTTAFDFNRLDKVLRKLGFERLGSGESSEANNRTDEHEFVRVNVLPDAKMK